MEISEVIETIDKAIAGRLVLSLERPEMAETELLCIPVARSDDLLLVHIFYDFYPDGYRIIRLEDVYTAIREGSEEFFEQVIRAEGVYNRLKSPPAIDLTGWQNVLHSLRGQYDYCIIECDEVDDFLIGKTMELGEWDFTFWYFDATGRWDEEMDVVDYEDLTAISFDDNYTNTIIKYIQKPQ
ncbi:MAG: hypothetical protein FWE32_00695 [Oscillospiraceae bacterium]|nr:hypothetical protein [Oscillospiraceae bacterium]